MSPCPTSFNGALPAPKSCCPDSAGRTLLKRGCWSRPMTLTMAPESMIRAVFPLGLVTKFPLVS